MVKPYNKSGSKKTEVRAMFDNIARNYDFLNHFLSLGVDVAWRKRLIKELKAYAPTNILDIATGTGDLAIMSVKTGAKNIEGVDLSEKMISVGNKKIRKRNLENKVNLYTGDAENLRAADESFDAAMVAFGVRNFEDLQKGLREINRVLQSKRPLLVLEFSKPVVFPVKQLYYLYSKVFLPFLGRLISKDQRAYTYLPESIEAFPDGQRFIDEMIKAGFNNCSQIKLSFGIATIYIGHKG